MAEDLEETGLETVTQAVRFWCRVLRMSPRIAECDVVCEAALDLFRELRFAGAKLVDN